MDTILTSAFLFGLFLLAAIFGGYAAHFVKIPRVIGFLLGGLALRLILSAVVEPTEGIQSSVGLEEAMRPLAAVKELALGMILFTIGSIFERSRLRSVGAKALKISCMEVSFSAVFVLIGCWILNAIAGTAATGSGNLILAVLLAVAAIATAPAATLLVLQEYESKGTITDTILGLTGLNNIVCIVVFYAVFLVLASFGAIETTGPVTQHLGVSLLVMTVGSVALGVVCGSILSVVHARLSLRETILVFFAMLILLGESENVLHNRMGLSFNFLLTALVIGGMFANLAINSQKLEESLQTIGSPIFACFFVMAGYGLHLGDLRDMGWLGGAYVLCRVAGKIVGCRLGVKWAGGPAREDGRLGGALLCQAAVVIGLATFVEHTWSSELAKTFTTVVLGSIVVFELVGPLLVKHCVVQGGEVKASTLLRRERKPEGPSVWLTMQSLMRLLPHRPSPVPDKASDLSVKHIMRSNVQLIPASATFDEVLQFIERSTHSHFPVVYEDGSFAGVIHFADVRDVIYDPGMRDLITAVDIADEAGGVVPTEMRLKDLLDIFTEQNVAVLPVVDDAKKRHIVGLVEQRDLLRALGRRSGPTTNNT